MENDPRSVSRRSLIKGASGAAAAGLLASPALAAATPGPQRAQVFQSRQAVDGGTFTFGSGKPPANIFNPHNTISTAQNIVIEAVFLRLVYGREWGSDMNPQSEGPIDLAIAETMTEIETDRVWEFKIRDNVKWHDGTPVTADDVIFGIWLSLNKDAKSVTLTPVTSLKGGDKLAEEGGGSLVPPYDLTTIEGAQKIDDMTVRIELTHPIPNYWVNWAVGYWPMPYHIFGQMPLENILNGPLPIGFVAYGSSKIFSSGICPKM